MKMPTVSYNALYALSGSQDLEEGNFHAFVTTLLQTLCRELGVERASVWRFENSQQRLSCLKMYSEGGRSFQPAQELNRTDCPAFFKALEDHFVLSVMEVAADRRTAELRDYLQAHGTQSLAAIQILYKGKLFGILLIEQCFTAWEPSRDVELYLNSYAGLISQAYGTAKQAQQQAVKGQEDNYKKLFNDSPIPMWVYDPDSLRFLDVNQAAITHYGYSKKEFLKLTILDIRPGTQAERLLQFIKQQKLQRWGKSEWAHQKKNGEVITVEIRSDWSIFQEKVCRIVMAFDITERKRVEERLQASEEMFNKAFEANPAALILTDEKGMVLQVNKVWTEITGYSQEEVARQPLAALGIYPKGFFNRLIDFHAKEQEESSPLELNICDKLNNIKPLLLSFQQVQYDAQRALIITGLDISQKRMDDALLAKRLQEKVNFRSALDNSAIISTSDLSGNIIEVNAKFVACTGYSNEELIGKNHSILNSGFHKASFWKHMWMTLKAGKPWRGEVKNRRKDGTHYWVEVTINPVRNANGQVYEYMSVSHNITKRKELQLNEEKLMKDLTEYAFLTSHKLRGPLARMLGLINLLELGAEKETFNEFLHKLRLTSEEMDQIIREMNQVIHRNTLPAGQREKLEQLKSRNRATVKKPQG